MDLNNVHFIVRKYFQVELMKTNTLQRAVFPEQKLHLRLETSLLFSSYNLTLLLNE